MKKFLLGFLFFFIVHVPQAFSLKILGGSHDEVLQFVRRYLPSNPIIVEAGAFDGMDSIRMLRFWPRAHLYTFEPIPELFLRTKENTKLFKNITCFPFALADFIGKCTMYGSEIHGDINDLSGSSSLLPPKEHLLYDRNITFNSSFDVDTITLDDWAKQQEIRSIDFMWLDMQGYELNMLKCSKIALTARVIYTEMLFVEAYAGQYVYQDIVNWMKDNGFVLIAIDFDPHLPFQDLHPPTSNSHSTPYFGNGVFVNSRYYR